MTPDEKKLEAARARIHSKGATAKDRRDFKRLSRKVAEARTAQRITEEKVGSRVGPHNPGDGVAQPETVTVKGKFQ